ncbi:MAG: SRPBCC family protein, partial [Ignavibacteria bacterium]|nr:SRPBCC family protein [Ignavibacteria bacterium]
MKAFKKILLIIGGLIGLALIVAAFLPSKYVVSRYLLIKRPPEVVFEQLSKFSNWENWSPWRPLDKDAKYTFSGTDGAVGSKMMWDGDTVGNGYLVMKKIEPFKRVETDLVFLKPWEMQSLDYFTLEEGHGNTLLTWVDEGELKYPLGRLFGVFSDMDKMMGPDFEKGLKNIKKLVESGIAIFKVDRPETKIYFISGSCSSNPNDIQNAMTSAY